MRKNCHFMLYIAFPVLLFTACTDTNLDTRRSPDASDDSIWNSKDSAEGEADSDRDADSEDETSLESNEDYDLDSDSDGEDESERDDDVEEDEVEDNTVESQDNDGDRNSDSDTDGADDDSEAGDNTESDDEGTEGDNEPDEDSQSDSSDGDNNDSSPEEDDSVTPSDSSDGNNESDECTDTPPDDEYSCQQQYDWGKCSDDWMAGYCEITCGVCVPGDDGTDDDSDEGPDDGSDETDPSSDEEPESSTSPNNASECGIAPVNPNSIPAVGEVLCFLYDIYGEYTLSGQQDCHWSNPQDLAYVNQQTGEYPAVVGGDFLYTNAVSQARDAWRSGSLPMIRYHMGRPEDRDSYESSKGTTDLDATLTPGTQQYNGLMSKIDHAANELTTLQNEGIVVLWAPFHETQPNGWFWWSKGSGDQFKQLWQIMFDNFMERGINNVIWLMPFSGSPSGSYYPGDQYVDISGPDTYDTSSSPWSQMYSATADIVGDEMPIPLHETGQIPNPDDMFNNNAAPWVLFSVWCTGEFISNQGINSVNAISHTYHHERTLNRGDLPTFD